ncbi:MAG TPA: VCBS repeat-containing protein [Planctomycetes bacterium]|nr:VCBS repeat-containing protein [Planctomycetota bacterium]
MRFRQVIFLVLFSFLPVHEVVAQLGTHFAMSVACTTSGDVRSMATGDVTGDGVSDVVCGTSGGIVILVGATGAWGGTLGASCPIQVPLPGSAPSCHVELGDLDGDGDLDIVSLDRQIGASTLWAYFNNGTGQFGAGVSSAGFPGGTLHFALGDLNGDGRADLALAATSPDHKLDVHLNQFSPAQTVPFPSPSSPHASITSYFRGQDVEIRDLDGDGDLDIAGCRRSFGTSTSGQSTVDVIENQNAATASLALIGSFSSTTSGNVRRIASGDLDGNGLPEIVVTNKAGDEVTILQNAGGFLFSSISLDAPGGNQGLGLPNDVVVVDLDADGDLDLVTSNSINSQSMSATLHVNLGGGNFATGAPTPTGALPSGIAGGAGCSVSTAVAALDIDVDSDMDLVFGCQFTNQVHTHRNTIPSIGTYPGNSPALRLSTTSFSAPTQTPLFSSGPGFDVKTLAIGDVLGIRIDSPDHSLDYTLPTLVGQFFNTGAAAPNFPGFPVVWVDPTSPSNAPFVIAPLSLFGTSPVLLPAGIQVFFGYSGGFAGTSLILQALLATGNPMAPVTASDAHEIRLL